MFMTKGRAPTLLSAILIFSVPLVGCERIEGAAAAPRSGTMKAYDACMSGKSPHVEEYFQLNLCRRRHERILNHGVPGATFRYDFGPELQLANPDIDVVITSVSINYQKENGSTTSCLFTGWIEGGGTLAAECEDQELSARTREGETRKAIKWNVVEVKGIRID